GWALRVRYTGPFNSKLKLQSGVGQAEAPVPGASVSWELLDPEGKSAWQATTEEQWSAGASKYLTGRKSELTGAMTGTVTTTSYTFRGGGMRGAVLEELPATVSGTPPRSLPRAILRLDGETRTLPIKAEYATPAGP